MQDRTDEGESKNIRCRDILPEDKLPPELTIWQLRFLCLARTVMFLAILYIVIICILIIWYPDAVPECICWPYLALAGFLSGLISDFFIRHWSRVHDSRKEDRSEIEALIQEAKNIQPRLTEPERPVGFETKHRQVQEEIERLTEDVGPEGWTEFQVLTLDRMLIDFLSLEDLKARARSSLDELREYAYGEAFSYNDNFYRDWEDKINTNINDLEEVDKKLGEDDERAQKIDDEGEALRANLRAVREHVAEYRAKWSEGSSIVSGIRICGAAAVVIFTIMGILPLLYPNQNCSILCDFRLSILNWGFLGIAGSIAIALLDLRNAKEVEVADTAGKQELSRVLLSAPLGLLAGVLVFSIIAGELINSGSAVPNLRKPEFKDAYLSIAWAVVAGMGFEGVFQRVRRAVES